MNQEALIQKCRQIAQEIAEHDFPVDFLVTKSKITELNLRLAREGLAHVRARKKDQNTVLIEVTMPKRHGVYITGLKTSLDDHEKWVNNRPR